MIKQIFVFIFSAIPFAATFSQTDTSKNKEIKITGALDVYYRYDFNKPENFPYNSYTSFTKSRNSFQLGMANIKFEHQTSKVDMVADLAFGEREKEFAYNDNGITESIKQLYISYSPLNWLKLTAGTWATHVNWELEDAYLNRNYSMDYLFTMGPFSHTGLKAEIIANTKNVFMIGISNATDYRSAPDGQINKKFIIAQYIFTPNDNLKLYLNYVSGKAPDTSKSSIINLVVTEKISGKLNIVYNGIISTTKPWNGDLKKNTSAKNWWGSAVYFNYDPAKWFGLTLRTEYFSDHNKLNLFSGQQVGGNVWSSTLSANFKVDNFIFIPEFRVDKASEKIFYKNEGSTKKTDAGFIIAAVYSF